MRSRRSAVFPSSWRGTQTPGKGENGVVLTTDTEPDRRPESSLYAALSNAIVRLMREYTGRGPTRARTTIRDNVVLVMLEQTLTKGEQILVDKGRSENVLALRREYQEAMREESSAQVAQLTGRNVIAMMSANHLDPDLAAEIYVLDRPPDYNHASPTAPSDPTITDGHPA